VQLMVSSAPISSGPRGRRSHNCLARIPVMGECDQLGPDVSEPASDGGEHFGRYALGEHALCHGQHVPDVVTVDFDTDERLRKVPGHAI
jgi:hypothetical protein